MSTTSIKSGKLDSTNLFLPRAEKYKNSHKGLAEELLQPNFKHNDMSRTQMFTSHFPQSVVLNNPEVPKVFSNFENHIGKYSSAVKSVPQDAKIISTFEYSIYKCYYLLEYADGTIDLHVAEPVKHLSEKFGYIYNNTFLDDYSIGDTIPKDTTIRSWPCNDENNNLQYGTNLKTVYQFFKGQTYEDAIVISDAAIEKLNHTSVTTMDVMVNANDILVNTLGNLEKFKAFPDIGEDITDGILTARRRIEHASIINNLTDTNLNKIFFESDTIFYNKGKVVDIEIFNNNSDIENIDKLAVYKQIKTYYTQQVLLAKWLSEVMSDITENPTKYSSTCAFTYRRYVEENFNWEYNDAQFDGIMIRFTIATTNSITVGSKVSNRYGGKGKLNALIKLS